MVNRLIRPLRRWQALEGVVMRLAGHFTIWPADHFGGLAPAPVGRTSGGFFAKMPRPIEPLRPPAPLPIPPSTVERRFMELHIEGRFDEMWEMVAEDAQRAWGARENFVREMPRLDQWMQILDMQVVSVTILESWIDTVHQRHYSNVARLVMRYRVRQEWKEGTFDRQVHLIPAAGDWRTLCYPTRVRTPVTR
jgi:hypothetical protein